MTWGNPRRWHVSRAATTAAGEQHTRSDADARGSIQSRRVTPTASGPAASRATALSTPPLIATAVRVGTAGALTAGPIAFASASTASVSPPTAAASSSVRPTRSRSRPAASAPTIVWPSTCSRTSAHASPRAESPRSSFMRASVASAFRSDGFARSRTPAPERSPWPCAAPVASPACPGAPRPGAGPRGPISSSFGDRREEAMRLGSHPKPPPTLGVIWPARIVWGEA